jgi:transglutaminase-like putative cysteine protease
MTRSGTLHGLRALSPAYQMMLSHDPHAAGSIDRRLMEGMVLLDSTTSERLYRAPTPPSYQRHSRPALESVLRTLPGIASDPITAITAYCQSLGRNVPDDVLTLRFGGTEEAIIARGSDWCTDVARVACALLQVSGLPARLVYLFDLNKAYSGHAVTEVFHQDAWGVIDPTLGILYRTSAGALSAAQLQQNPAVISGFHSAAGTPASHADLYGTVGISEYAISDTQRYTCTVTAANHYTRTVLDMGLKGWPGGLRWLFGEDD